MRTVKLTAVDASGEVFTMHRGVDESWGSDERVADKFKSECAYSMRVAQFVPVSITVEVF